MNKIRIVYYSSTGNTYEMANALERGILAGGGETKVYRVTEDFDKEDVFSSDIIALGSSACGAETIEEAHFIPFIMDNQERFKDKKVFLFGAWGWGNGEYMDIWKERLEEMGAKVFDKIILSNEVPNDEVLSELEEMGKSLLTL